MQADNAAMSAYVARVESVPAIKAYLESEAFLTRPLNNPHATFK